MTKRLLVHLFQKTIILLSYLDLIQTIFQKIFNTESKAIITQNGPILQKKVESISSQDLSKDYMLDRSSEELLSTTPPFNIKLKALEQTAYTFNNDTLPPASYILSWYDSLENCPSYTGSSL